MKPIIGIISREYYSELNYKINIFYNSIIEKIINNGGIPIGIPYDKDILNYLDICQGFILEGGNDPNDVNLATVKRLAKLNIPLLGICLGMQEMALSYNGKLYDIENHKIDSFHKIKIEKNSLLYCILNKNQIFVNSRHKSAVKNTKLRVSSRSDDGIIEAIEDDSLDFFLGLQWHPECLTNDDSNKIFKYFINICKKRCK